MVFRALTVGDGDLSFSLALKRAYPQISVTASTLVDSPAELCRTYTSAVETCKEFQGTWNEEIVYRADATKLAESITARAEDEKFDIVLFNLPHLGDGTLVESEPRHAERHFVLLAHYFSSAKTLLTSGGRIHVCLSGNQPKSWNVMLAAEINGLRCVGEETTACPIDKWMFDDGGVRELADVRPHYRAKRKFRNGSLGTKHFLARYGYRHRRTEGDLFDGSVRDIIVDQSINIVFACSGNSTTDREEKQSCREDNICKVCCLKFENSDRLSAHLDAPGLPDFVTCGRKRRSVDKEKNQLNQLDSTNNSKKQTNVSLPSKLTNIEDATILCEASVDSRFDSKRIKWLCRQDGFPLSQFITSKSICDNAIREGRIFVNRQVALDSSRIVRENDVVSLIQDFEPAEKGRTTTIGCENFDVRIVKEVTSKCKDITIEMVFKPVGTRCVGSFSPNTLEMIIKKHAEYNRGVKQIFCKSVSKLDTFCEGLCVLVASPVKIDEHCLRSLKVVYTFDALVHGQPPEEWKRGVFIQVPTEGLRQWKMQKTKQQENNADNVESIDITSISQTPSSTALDLDGALFIKCHDSIQFDNQQQISTLTVKSSFDNGRLANVISYVLRKQGHPVVNDRFGRREYSFLPRRMKNIVKQKVCIGCYCLDVEDGGEPITVHIDSHKRTQCSFWRGCLQK